MADVVYKSEPWLEIPGKTTLNLFTMDYAYLGQPFVRGEYQQQQIIITGNIKRIMKVPFPYVKKVINVEG